MNETGPVLAAGIIGWRKIDGKTHVLLIHRHGHRDISFPKGKLDPGESLPSTAVRELAEETGVDVFLEAPLTIARYDLPGGTPKEVWYWAAKLTKKALEQINSFVPNDEVSSLSLVESSEAHKLLSYRKDQQVLEVLEDRIQDSTAETFAVILERHAKATSPSGWLGDDEDRPLTDRGLLEAGEAAVTVARYGVSTIWTSPAERCIQTVAPLEAIAQIKAQKAQALSQYPAEFSHRSQAAQSPADAINSANLDELIETVMEQKTTTLLCSHGPILPSAMSALFDQSIAELTPDLYRSAVLSTAESVLLHFSKKGPLKLVALEKYAADGITSTVTFGRELA